jgi:hypothetical protein
MDRDLKALGWFPWVLLAVGSWAIAASAPVWSWETFAVAAVALAFAFQLGRFFERPDKFKNRRPPSFWRGLD